MSIFIVISSICTQRTTVKLYSILKQYEWMSIVGNQSEQSLLPMAAAGGCKYGAGRQAPRPVWPAGTPASASVSDHGC